MLSSADAMGKIQQHYMDGSRPVPYLMFMHIFNELLDDSVRVVPKEPSDELKERFRAVCMAVNVGVHDSEGRGDARVREFKEKVVPVWREKLSAEEFDKYQDILGGGMRAKFRKEETTAAADTVAESASSKTSDLLRRLGITPAGEEGTEPAEAESGLDRELEVSEEPLSLTDAAEKAFELGSPEGSALEEPEELEVPMPAQEGIPDVFGSIDELIAAVRGGQLPTDFGPRQDMTPHSRYRIGDHEVEIRLVTGNTRNYAIGAVNCGYAQLANSEDLVDDIANEMGYRKSDEFTYRRREGDFLLRIRMLADRLDMPVGYPKGGGPDILIQQIQKVHRDLGEVLERMEA